MLIAVALVAAYGVGASVLPWLRFGIDLPWMSSTSGFISRTGTELSLDGHAYRFDGMNIPQGTGAPCWAQGDLAAALAAIGPGQEVARVFSFQRTATTQGVRDWSRLDDMLKTFRARGQRVVMVLSDQWRGQPCADVPANRTIDWYESGYRTTVEQASTYRDWVGQIALRYRDDPTIAFWELLNEGEARNADGTCSEQEASAALRAFADDVGGLIKGVDPNHLVSLGTISGECGSNEDDYAFINASVPLDICDYHDSGYALSPTGNSDRQNGFQVSLERCHADGKAFFVGEIVSGLASLSPPTATTRASLLDAKLAAQFAAGSSGEIIWTWSNTFSADPPRDQEITPGDPALALLTKY
jgi:mannan endo-1,4-beta-mannosidase